jgi:peptidoglycan hydrolase-like protein with peptidoglycan-binding domain
MILQVLAGLAVLGGLYEYTQGDDTSGKVQAQKGITPQGVPVATVVPVTKTVSSAQANPSLFVPAPKVPGYLPPPAHIQTPSATLAPSGVLTLPPIVVTPSGAASVAVQSISDLQGALNALGVAMPPLPVSGNMDPATQAAIRTFQMVNGLNVSGIFDPATKSALSQALSTLASPNATIGQSAQVLSATLQSAAATVPIVSNKDIQHALNLLGATPQLKEDGILGPLSIAAVKAFQTSHGMLADGIAGPMTRTALQVALNNPVGPPAIMQGESWDLYERARPRKREDNNYHPDRKHYWDPEDATTDPPGFINESELGMRFSEARQKMMRDDGSDVPFGVDSDFGSPMPPSMKIAPPPPPVAAPPPPPSSFIAPPTGMTRHNNPNIPVPTGYMTPSGVVPLGSPMIAPPPPPPVMGPVYPPPPPSPGFFPPPPPFPGQRYPFQNQPPYGQHFDDARRRARHLAWERQLLASQNQNQDLGAGAAPMPDPSQFFDPSQQMAAVASAPDPSQASTVVSAVPNVPADQTVDPVLDQAIADAQSGAIDATTGASASILAAGADFGYSSGRGGDFRHMGGTFGFGGGGGSHGRSGHSGGSGHHRHHAPPPPSPDDDDDSYGAEFGVIAPPGSSNASFLAAAARNAAAGMGAGQSAASPGQMYYPPPPPTSGYPYQGPQGPSAGGRHHHHHHHSQQSQPYAQPQNYGQGYGDGSYGDGSDDGSGY